jgi:hypothetical protein
MAVAAGPMPIPIKGAALVPTLSWAETGNVKPSMDNREIIVIRRFIKTPVLIL